ncbi:flavodoxin domain-containing protein [Blastococcus sp. SYSU D00922]
MTVLVAYASRRGSTREIAERIAARLRSHGFEVHLDPLLGREQVGHFQAVVLGSPIYGRRWEREAVDFCRRNAAALAGHAVWTFSVGWPGTADGQERDARHLDEVHRLVPAREHHYFHGALAARDLPLVRRVAFGMRRGRTGDLRDWPAIDAWADAIAAQLPAPAGSPGPGSVSAGPAASGRGGSR